MIIPAVPGCGCDYRCLALDMRRSNVICVCPRNWNLDQNGKSCICKIFQPYLLSLLNRYLMLIFFAVNDSETDSYTPPLITVLIVIIVVLVIAFGALCFILCKKMFYI